MVQLVIWSCHLCREMLVIRCDLKCRKETTARANQNYCYIDTGSWESVFQCLLRKNRFGFYFKGCPGKSKVFPLGSLQRKAAFDPLGSESLTSFRSKTPLTIQLKLWFLTLETTHCVHTIVHRIVCTISGGYRFPQTGPGQETPLKGQSSPASLTNEVLLLGGILKTQVMM